MLNAEKQILKAKIEECIVDWEIISISDIMHFLELPSEKRPEVNSLVNDICFEREWLIITERGKLFVSSMRIANNQLKAIICHHKNGVIEKAIPKTIPQKGDWCVNSVTTPDVYFYYSSQINRDVARWGYSKVNNVKFVDTRIKIYK